MAVDEICDPTSEVPNHSEADLPGWALKARTNPVFEVSGGVLNLGRAEALKISSALPNASTQIGQGLRSYFLTSMVGGYEVPYEFISRHSFVRNKVYGLYVQLMNAFLLRDSRDLPGI